MDERVAQRRKSLEDAGRGGEENKDFAGLDARNLLGNISSQTNWALSLKIGQHSILRAGIKLVPSGPPSDVTSQSRGFSSLEWMAVTTGESLEKGAKDWAYLLAC